MTLESTIRKMYVKEIDLDELIESLDEGGMKDKLLKTADLLQKLIKPGDPDRHDFAAVRDHIESNNMKTVKQIVMNMDTEPRERVVVAMAKGLGRAETEKILGVKLNMGEEVELDEKVQFEAPTKDGNTFQVIDRDTKGMRGKQDKFKMQIVDKRGKVIKDLGSHPSLNGAKGMAKNRGIIEEVELDEAKKYQVVAVTKAGETLRGGKGSKKEADDLHWNMAKSKKYKSVEVVVSEEVELDERSAAAQARRDARGEFDDKPEKGDDVATDADKKRGDENIINQLRKALDNPKHEVRFADGKSEVVKPDIVKAALKIFMQLKSNDKRKLQPIYAKSAKSLTSIVSRMMRKMHYEGVEEMNEDFRTGRFGVSHSLVDAVKDVIMGKRINEKEGDKEAYQKFFQKALKKFGVSSPSELKGDKEKEFYDYVDKNWTADHEESKKVNEAAKKAVKEDEEEHDDEDEKETAKKAKKDEPKKNGKEKVEVDPTLDEKLDEGSMKDKLIKTSDLIQKMIKPGDPDRHDYAAARDHIEANNMKTLKKIVMNMDTVPKEKIAVALAKGLGKAEAEKILGVKLNMSEEVKEEMTEAQKEKREEIVKELKKKTEDFKKKYGDRWEDVMYATATKMAMKAA